MEKEADCRLAFLDVLVLKRIVVALVTGFAESQSTTDRYLDHAFNHHPWQKRTLMKTLVDLGGYICKPHFLEEKLGHLNSALQVNGYSTARVKRALRPCRPGRVEVLDKRKVFGSVFLPSVRSVTDRIGREVARVAWGVCGLLADTDDPTMLVIG